LTRVLHIGFGDPFEPRRSVSTRGTMMRRTQALEEQVLKRPRIEELGCEVEVRRHPGARRLTLRVSRTRRAVIVTMPVQCDLGEAGNFLNRNLEWVRERLDSLPRPVPFCNGALMPLRGDFHRLSFGGKRTTAGVVQRTCAGTAVPQLRVAGRPEHAARRLRDWLLMKRAAISTRASCITPAVSAWRPSASRYATRRAAGARARRPACCRSPGG